MEAAAEIDLDLDPNFEPQTRSRSNTWPLRPTRELEPQSSPCSTEDPSLPVTPDQQQNAKDPLGLTAKKSGSRRNAWGNLSYADLITKAIQSSPEKRLTLSQIYDWMVQNVPYFKDKGDSTSSAGWKNSIRHNLSLHSRFMRIQNEGTGKSSWWVINPDAKPGKTPRRRAGSMETKNYEKKRGRVRKKVEALCTAMENGGTLSPGGSEDYLEALSFGDFRPRASSNASSCGRLSPIHAVAEPDLHDNQVPPMSPIPWGTEVSDSPTLYPGGENYSDLVDSLGDGMKLSNQDSLNMDVVSGLRDPYLSGTARDFNNLPNFLGVDRQSSGLDNQFSHLPAPPPYPKQVNGLEFRQNYTNGMRLQCRASPVNIQSSSAHFSQNELFNNTTHEFNDTVLIKQDQDGGSGLSPVGIANNPNSLSINVNTQQQLSSPDRSQQGSPNSGSFTTHLSPQAQTAHVSSQPVSPLNCQLSPQTNRHLVPAPITTTSLQQGQHPGVLQQATESSILREALTRGPLAFRSPTTPNMSSPTFSPVGGNLSLGSVNPLSASNINTAGGLLGLGLNVNSNNTGGPHHHQHTLNPQLRSIQEHVTDNQVINSHGLGNLINSNSSGGIPHDIDMDLISGMDYDMDQVIKQELTLEGNLDFNFDATPPTSVGQNVVH